MSDIAASIDDHRSITALNDVGLGFASGMDSSLGHIGLFGKANTARDCGTDGRHNASMAKRKADSEEKAEFIRRVKLARMARYPTQDPICTILGIEQGVYKHYESRSQLPHKHIPKFVAATGVTYEWLLAGQGKAPSLPAPPSEPKKRIRRGKKAKEAA